MNDIIVGGKNIILLYSSAEGFKHAFFVVYNSYNDNDKSFYWNNKDILSVTGTIGVFAIELYLKFLSVIETYKVKSHSGKHMKTHNLVDIYNKIKSSPIISNLTTDFHNKEKISLLDFLDNCKTNLKNGDIVIHQLNHYPFI